MERKRCAFIFEHFILSHLGDGVNGRRGLSARNGESSLVNYIACMEAVSGSGLKRVQLNTFTSGVDLTNRLGRVRSFFI